MSESPRYLSPNPDDTPSHEIKHVSSLREMFSQAMKKMAEKQHFNRATCDGLLQRTLEDLPPSDITKIASLMERRGVMPDARGNHHIEDLPDEEQNVLANPDGLFLQCLNLSRGARVTASLLRYSSQEIQDLTFAGAVINTGKAKQIAGLKKSKKMLDEISDEDVVGIAMLDGYEAREFDDYIQIGLMGIPEGVTSILEQNIRHNPAELRTPAGKLMYYNLYCQDPGTGFLVPVEQRVNKSIERNELYGPLYRGYAAQHGEDLVGVHQDTIGKLEDEIYHRLYNDFGYRVSDLKTFLNGQIAQV
jgi:hypothetical protein